MLIIYPMIVSKAVSENIIPGLSKTLETYIIANAKDSIISQPDLQKRNYNFKIKGKTLIATESEILFEDDEDNSGPYGMGKGNKQTPNKTGKTDPRDREKWEAEEKRREKEHQLKKAKEDREQEKWEAEKAKRAKEEADAEKEKIEKAKLEKAKRARTDVKIQDDKALSITPSFIEIKITDKWGNERNESLGVKVVPLRVKSDEKLSRLLLHDIQMNNFTAMMVGIGRKITRVVWSRFVDRWSSKSGGALTPSGDPRRDIIMGRTGHQGQGFVVLSKSEDIDEIFLSNISRINRLFKMGWGNIIICDDVNRMAYFCMKPNKGVCMAISYAMIYQNFGQLKVYDSLEDAKRQTSSIFKIRKPMSKVISEWAVENKLSKYICEETNNE